MAPEIKFCGLTRPDDAEQAVALGASYTGVIFAGGPRMLSLERAEDVLAPVPARVRRVGVFASQPASEIADVARRLSLAVVQLHGTTDPGRIRAVKDQFNGDVWAVIRVEGEATALPAAFNSVRGVADGVLLDAYVAGALGGTGRSFSWRALAPALAAARSGTRIVLAGGLRPENVGEAIAALAPDVVDVSSGVESTPGIKDHDRMRAFRDAVQTASGSR